MPARTAIAVHPIRSLRIVMCNKVFRARHTHLYSYANAEKRVYGTRTIECQARATGSCVRNF